MADKVENVNRLARNTLMLYGRMLFGLLVSFYSSRVILDALGETDYGVYDVVGGVVGMFSMVSGALSAAISRFQAYELGTGDIDRLKNAYSVSVFIQIILSIIAVVAVETVGVWFLNTHMTIPADRMHAANIVLQCSLVTCVSGLLVVPTRASVMAHEKMEVFAITSIAEIVFKLLIAVFLAYSGYKGDKLIIYAALLMFSTLTIQVAYSLYCRRNFQECHFSGITDRKAFKEIVEFASWNFFGTSANVLNNYGINIVLNIIYGPAVNAARGVTNTVSNIVANFVNNFTIAMDPQMIKAFGAKDKDFFMFLVYRGAKFTFFIFLFLGLPVLLEADFLMSLWLVDVPEHAVNFVRLSMMLIFIDLLSNTLYAAQIATGFIKKNQIASSIVQLLNVITVYLLLKIGLRPEYCYVIGIMVPLFNYFIRLYMLHTTAGLDMYDYFKRVTLLVLLVFALSAFLPYILHSSIGFGWIRFLSVCFSSVLCSFIAVFYIGCNKGERQFLQGNVKKILAKFLPKR